VQNSVLSPKANFAILAMSFLYLINGRTKSYLKTDKTHNVPTIDVKAVSIPNSSGEYKRVKMGEKENTNICPNSVPEMIFVTLFTNLFSKNRNTLCLIFNYFNIDLPVIGYTLILI